MNPGDTVEYNSLNWVKKELDLVLEDAQKAFNIYIEDTSETEKLKECIDQLHLIHGTLLMVELYGAAMLAEEIENLIVALSTNDVQGNDEIYQLLMGAMLRLPDYLDGLVSGNKDVPIILLPLLNDLRAARNESLLSENLLFFPDVHNEEEVSQTDETVALSGEQLQKLAKRLRPHFQLGLLGWIKGEKPGASLKRIQAVVNELEKSSTEKPVKRLWSVSAALLEGLIQNGIDSSVSIKLLLGKIDRLNKELIDGGEQALAKSMPADVVKNLLYYIARSRTDGARVSKVKEVFRLNELLPAGTAEGEAGLDMGGPNADLLETVSGAIREDFTEVKDALELYVHGEERDKARLESLPASLQKIADTMGMLGLGAPRQMVLDQKEQIQKFYDGELEANDQQVMEVASVLLSAEAKLNNFIARRSSVDESNTVVEEIPDSEYQDVLSTVAKEALQDFSQAKQAILMFADSPDDEAQLKLVLNLFAESGGAMFMAPLDILAPLIRGISEYIETVLLKAKQIIPEQLDVMADAVTAIEYYLEAIVEGRKDYQADLNFGRRAVDKLLGYMKSAPAIVSDDALAVTELEVSAEPDSEEIPVELPEEVTRSELEEITFEEEPEEDAFADVLEPGVNELDVEDELVTFPEENEPEPVVDEPEVASAPPQREELAIIGEVDEEIFEIFIEEALEELGSISENLPLWKSDHGNEDAMTTVRRSFHTLKGSGRLIGAMMIGEFAWSMENLLNRVIDKSISLTPEAFDVLDEAVAVLPQLIEQLKGNKEPIKNIYDLMDHAEALSKGEKYSPPAETEVVDETISEMEAEPSTGELSVDEFSELSAVDLDEVSGIDFGEETADDDLVVDVKPDLPTEIDDAQQIDLESGFEELTSSDDSIDDSIDLSIEAAEDDLDFGLGDINATEIEETDSTLSDLDVTDIDINEMELDSDDEFSVDMDDIESALEVSDSFEGADDEIQLDVADEIEDEIDLSSLAETSDDDILIDLVSDEPEIEFGEDDVSIAIDEEPSGLASIPAKLEIDAELFKIFQAESEGHLQSIRDLLEAHENHTTALAPTDDLIRALHTLYGSARTAEVPQIADICGIAEKFVKQRNENGGEAFNEIAVLAIQSLVTTVGGYLEDLVQGSTLTDNPDLIAAFEQLNQQELTLKSQSSAAPAADIPDNALTSYGDIDDELVDIFLEEADELTESAETSIQNWTENRDDKESVAELQRILHTLKGGARMAELIPIGDLTHALESMIIDASDSGKEVTDPMMNAMHEAMDSIVNMLNKVKDREPIASAADVIARLHQSQQGHVEPEVVIDEPEAELVTDDFTEFDNDEISIDIDENEFDEDIGETLEIDSGEIEIDITGDDDLDVIEEIPETSDQELLQPEVEPEVVSTEPSSAEIKPFTLPDQKTDEPEEKSRNVQEQVRVRAELLNNLVNNAGEVNIYNGRFNQQLTGFGFNLNELDQTITRLREQLRNLELETEAQIISHHETEQASMDDDFDLLEMDQYSTIQQLSRSLAESVSDLESIKDELSHTVRESETLLLQQSRISTELQESLMRTRMVQFSGIGTRLKRIVRQTSRELNKAAELHIVGDVTEVDRSVLDRIVSPLEHLLRNAVSHGIESPEDRTKAGKPETGHIQIDVEKDGQDLVVKVSDDGSGIRVQAIKKKAIERGLMTADIELSDHEIVQFILESGFSTADNVTQISGRGVGMDVVDSEIKQLGGTLDIESREGKGTIFTARLPMTLSINQALLVHEHEDVFAVPLNTVEGVVRLTGFELMRFYEDEEARYEFAGEKYEMRYLGYLLKGKKPDYLEQSIPYPVLLVKTGDLRVAIQVDSLVGRREIVVKPVGPQISTVRGISGATILGDGRVVLILDMASLLRAKTIFQIESAAEEVQKEAAKVASDEITVMVVDDSITIRKVTERILHRHGMEVILAKDGLDASAKLQERVPDIMLLDIEMPRMDGYELATMIRNNEHLKDIPIIMITSRTGTKHKEKALEIGVNRYLGKPYQEDDLMENINAVLEEERAKAKAS